MPPGDFFRVDHPAKLSYQARLCPVVEVIVRKWLKACSQDNPTGQVWPIGTAGRLTRKSKGLTWRQKRWEGFIEAQPRINCRIRVLLIRINADVKLVSPPCGQIQFYCWKHVKRIKCIPTGKTLHTQEEWRNVRQPINQYQWRPQQWTLAACTRGGAEHKHKQSYI